MDGITWFFTSASVNSQHEAYFYDRYFFYKTRHAEMAIYKSIDLRSEGIPMERKIKIILSVAVASIFLSGSYLSFFQPKTNIVADAKITEVSSGYSTFVSHNVTYTYPYVNFAIRFASPLNLNPYKLIYRVTNSAHKIELPYPGGYVSGLNATYSQGSYPEWLTQLPTGAFWTGYSGIITNPNGRGVGSYFNNGTWVCGNTAIKSGAILQIDFPIYISSIQGFVINLIYSSSTVASVNLTNTTL